MEKDEHQMVMARRKADIESLQLAITTLNEQLPVAQSLAVRILTNAMNARLRALHDMTKEERD